MRNCCCNAASGLVASATETARRVRGEVTTAPNVGDGLEGREDPPPPEADANRPAASDVHDEGVAGRSDGECDGDDDVGACTCAGLCGGCGCESSCMAHLSAATSCSRFSRFRANWLCARATAASLLPSTNARTARSTSCASASLAIAPGTVSNVAYPRAMRSSSAIRISSSTRASSLKSSSRASIVCRAEIGREDEGEDGGRTWSV